MQKKVSSLHHFRTLGRKNFGIGQKLVGKVVEIAFKASSGKLKEKPVSEKNCIHIFSFLDFERFYSFLAKKLGAGMSKLYAKRPNKHFEELNIFEKIIFFLSFSDN